MQNTTEKVGEKEKHYVNRYIIPYSPLILLILIVGVLSYYRVSIQMDIGPLSDTCDFLLNAMYFSGHGVGYYDWSRPPFFPFLVSIPLRFGFIDMTTIYIVDAFMFILGVIGLYFLLNLHFNKIESFFGAFLYATFPNIVLLLGLGFSDFTTVTLLIWAFYFVVLGVKRNSKYFILFFPFLMMAFLTRYNAALVVFPVLLYLLINKKEIKGFKNIIFGLIASFLIIVPVFIFFYQKFGNIYQPFTSTFGNTASSSFLPEYYPFDPNIFYFIEKFPIHTGFEGILILLIIFLGLLAVAVLKLRNNSLIDKESFKQYKSDIEQFNLKLIAFIVILVIFIGTFGVVPYLATEITFFILGLIFYLLVKNLTIHDLDLHILIFSWLMAFFIFNSVFVIKSDRYFILMAPAIAYFLILGLRTVSNNFSYKVKNRNITFPLITVILTSIIILSTFTYLSDIRVDNQDYKFSNEQITIASEWFKEYDPDYRNKIIYSDLWPYLGWSLKTNIRMMPIFKNNQTYVGGVKNSTFTTQDSIAFNNFLVFNNADYYFCVQNINLTSYKPIKQFGSLIIYEKI